jgi:ABC-type lipoprotein release transport system permease subunit
VRWLGGKMVRARATLGTALRGVIVNRMRAFLSSLGIAIGVATLIAIASLVMGLQKSFGEQIAGSGPTRSTSRSGRSSSAATGGSIATGRR